MHIPFFSPKPQSDYIANRVAAYLMYAFFTLHFVLPLYINSNFLTSLVSEPMTSFVYAAAAVIAIFTMATVNRALPLFGNYRSIFTLLIAEIGVVGVLAIPTAPGWILLGAFIAHWILTAVIKFNLDIFLEQFSDDAATGEIRGTLITLNHIAYIVGPLIAGFILGEDAFWQMYLVSAVLVLPPLLILVKNFREFHDPHYTITTLKESVRRVWRSVNVRFVVAAIFILRLFFTTMVVYTPLYLRRYVGLGYDEIGIIFSIMLLPFVFFARPLGELADRYWGEKELLISGFFVTAGFTLALAFVDSTAVLVWGGLLFGTRVGATMVQTMSEGYFFKHVESSDTDAISVLRMIRPLSYIVGPLLTAAFLAVLPFSYIFVAIAIILLFGAAVSVPIVDTR